MPSTPTTHDPFLETQVFWGRNKTPILIGLLAALCLLVAFGGYRVYTMRRDNAAAAELATAKGAADFQKVIADYPGSNAAASASLWLAEEQRKEQKFADAIASLQAFVKQWPKHELITTARLAMAGNLESLGKPDEALEMYRKIASDYPRDFNAPVALLSEVHLLQAKGQTEEARRVCETVLTQYRESYSSQEASRLLRLLKPPTPAVSAAPAPAISTIPAAPAPVASPTVSATP